MRTKRAAFTLIELLVVVAIIALLMAIMMPVLSRAKESAKRVVCSNQCRQIGVAITAYAESWESKMPFYGDPMHVYALYRGDKPEYADASGKLIPMKLACLYEGRYIADPRVFYCPSNIISLYKYASYNNPPPWGTLPQEYNTTDGGGHNQWVRDGYSYFPTDPRTKKNAAGIPLDTAKRIDQINSHIPYMTDIIRHREEISHKRQKTFTIHALFSDNHVRPFNDARLFDDPMWVQLEQGILDERTLCYKAFTMISP